MNTPFSLHGSRAGSVEPPAALLLLSGDPADLLSLCLQIGHEAGRGAPLPMIYSVAGGFLVRLPAQGNTVGVRPFAGVIRLGQLAANLFLPLGAELRPSLFPDEAAALVRKRGLVFLPGGRVLAFDPDQPVPPARLLSVRRLQAEDWQPLPQVALPAERLAQVLLDRPQESSDTVFSTGGDDIGVEDPEPPPGPIGQAGARVRQGLGTGLGWLGRAIGWDKLARMGGHMADAARQTLQRLSDNVRDRQEQTLRQLLRWFQEGKLEAALRRALPLNGEGGRGGELSTASDLPTHDPRYSLFNILGGGSGPGSVWTGGLDVQAQLAVEYRKAAEAATAAGDFRRAAFIYGKLLRDYRLAADVLSRGGLHHDAAILYLDKLADYLAAARAFEAAGEFDRAVQLYRQRDEHVLAGDLLRKMGEETQAVAEYELALTALVGAEQFHSAGELILSRLSRVERALECFRAGWQQRPRGSPIPCLHRLALLLAEQSRSVDLLALVDEAASYLRGRGSDNDCSSFFSEVVRLSDLPNLSGVRDRLRDRALLGLAGHLRSRAGVERSPGTLVATLFGHAGVWTAAQVSDAEVAVKARLGARKVQKTSPGPRTAIPLRLYDGRVTAACMAAESGTLFVAFEDGSVQGYSPDKGSTESLPMLPGGAWSLATDREGIMVLALGLAGSADDEPELITYARLDGPGYRLVNRRRLFDLAPFAVFSSLLVGGGEPRGVIWSENQIIVLQGHGFLPVGRKERSGEPPLFPGLLGVLPLPTSQWDRVLLFDDQSATLSWLSSDRVRSAPLGWIARPQCMAAQVLSVSGIAERLLVDVVRVGDEGRELFWSRLLVEDASRIALQGSATSKQGGYLAAALVASRRLAAVHEGGIDWLQMNGRRLEVASSTDVNLTGACGCFFSPPTGEVLVLCEDGYLVRVAAPQ